MTLREEIIALVDAVLTKIKPKRFYLDGFTKKVYFYNPVIAGLVKKNSKARN